MTFTTAEALAKTAEARQKDVEAIMRRIDAASPDRQIDSLLDEARVARGLAEILSDASAQAQHELDAGADPYTAARVGIRSAMRSRLWQALDRAASGQPLSGYDRAALLILRRAGDFSIPADWLAFA